MKKILGSVGVLAVVGALVLGATGAFFSDTETSTGNTFTAGAIDLQIDNTSYYNGEFNEETSWIQKNLESGDWFFNFQDLKPGDWGEDTISLHVGTNDAYACLDVRLDSNDDNGLTEPEEEDSDTTDGDGEGELADAVNFVWWADDGDNVYETDEGQLFPSGPLGNLEVGEVATVALAEPAGGIFDGALEGDKTYYIGKAWCFGDFDVTPVTQDGQGYTGTVDNPKGTNGPDVRSSGISCNGANEDNQTQTDSLTATISFMAVQSRNNDNFRCTPHLGQSDGEHGSAAPVVDGIISAGEYDGALSMLITNAGGGTVKAKTQGGYLYLAADIITDTTDNRVVPGFNDEFGVNLGESPTTDTIILGLGSTNANGRTVGTIDGYYTNFATTGHSLVALFGTGHRVIEWKIPLTAIPSIVNSDTLSIGGATESTDGNSAVYPIGLTWGNNATYGQLVVTP